MLRTLPLVVGIALMAAPAHGDDAMTPETVQAVKKATAYIRVQGPNWKGNGSGFVVAAKPGTIFVATNHHVVAGLDFERQARLAPGEMAKAVRIPVVTVVLDAGTPTERAYRAEVVAADPDKDLAVLRITGVKNPPPPLDLGSPKPVETMAVYTFGFPFGQALATTKGAPAITVGQAAVSSLRLNDKGELALIQIDGNLNPGNSGGPVVDSKGRLVGVAVSKVTTGEGIGFVIPAADVVKVLKGRLGGLHVSGVRAADGKLAVRAEVGIIDPVASLKGVTLHYLVVGPGASKPDPKAPLAAHPGVRKIAMNRDGLTGSAVITLDSADGDLFVQAVPDGGAGVAGATRVWNFALEVSRAAGWSSVLEPTGDRASLPAVKPPAGWKEYVPSDKSYTVWVPDQPRTQTESGRMTRIRTFPVKSNVLLVELAGGLKYSVEEMVLPLALAWRLQRAEMEAVIRDAIAVETGGRITEVTTARLGTIPGKEYRLATSRGQVRLRVFAGASRLFALRVTGTTEQVESADAEKFLNSCRLPGPPHGPDTHELRTPKDGNDPETPDRSPEPKPIGP